ncbi:MAG TPA: carboxypeptidase regulatory-like domain-containing protein [Blastocatellia bacterium]|nr:carboxypeptidase regulatory-like domain-containing protein [Blastocatellia bacterium]
MKNRTLSALFILLFVPIAALAQNGMIAGKVRSSGGTAVVNALVELRESGGSLVAQVLTRNDGDFTFMQLAPREYQIIVTAEGYAPGKDVAQIRGAIRPLPSGVINEVVTVEIVLEPRAESALAAPGTSFVQEVPRPARAAYAKGMSRIAEGKSDEGLALLREAIAEFSDYFDAHLALGAECYRRGRDADALEALERARQINGREAAVYYMFGLVMARQQKFQTAEYAFGKASELNAAHVGSHFNHAVALIELALRS